MQKRPRVTGKKSCQGERQILLLQTALDNVDGRLCRWRTAVPWARLVSLPLCWVGKTWNPNSHWTTTCHPHSRVELSVLPINGWFALVCLIRSEYDRVVCASLIYGYLCNHFFSCRLWHVRNITQDQRLASCHTMYNAWQMCRNIIKILNTVQSSWQFQFKLAPWQRS